MNLIPDRIPRIVALQFAAELLLAALYGLTVLTGGIHHSFDRLVNLGGEGTLPAWFAAVQLALVSGLFLILAVSERQQGRSLMLGLSAALAFLFLSADEASELHKRIGGITDILLPGGTREGTAVADTGIWMFILVPVLLAGVGWWGLKARKFMEGAAGARVKMIAGVAIFVIAAAGVEFLLNFAAIPGWLAVQLIVEEIGEMVGITFILWGLLDLMKVRKTVVKFV